MEATLYILTGYTAVGKTRLSLDWAKANNAEIVSCDSLLFYQHMDIGTAKPTLEERTEVPHHAIDVVPPSRQYSISEYLELVTKVVADIQRRGKKVLVVGGSGFYLQAFFGAVVDGLELEPSEKALIESKFENQSLVESVEELRRLNPEGLGDLDIKNPRRVLKAWLRCVAAGKPLLQVQEEFRGEKGAFDHFEKRLLVLTRSREELADRIQLRVDAMLAEGLVDEVGELLQMGIEKNPSAANAIGYRETISFLKGELQEKDLAGTIAANTRKLVKKQRTWFKKFLPVEAQVDVSSLQHLPENWYQMPPAGS